MKNSKKYFLSHKAINYLKLTPIQQKTNRICDAVLYHHSGKPPYEVEVNQKQIVSQSIEDLKTQIQKAVSS